MSVSIGIWSMKEGRPCRVRSSSLGLERQLEEWIENDPTLVGSGLQIVGRQFAVGREHIDILALDLQGEWVVIEVKRGQLNRDTLAQALDYASNVAAMPEETLIEGVNAYLKRRSVEGARTLNELLEQRHQTLEDCLSERKVRVILVGTGRDPNLQRIVDFLSDQGGIAISVVTFDVFSLPAAGEVLVRELTERDQPDELDPGARRAYKQPKSKEELYEQAAGAGIGDAFRRLVEGAVAAGLYPRLWPHSIMLTPPNQGLRSLITVWTQPTKNGELSLNVSPDAFVEFFGLSKADVVAALGDGWTALPVGDVETFVARLSDLTALSPGPRPD